MPCVVKFPTLLSRAVHVSLSAGEIPMICWEFNPTTSVISQNLRCSIPDFKSMNLRFPELKRGNDTPQIPQWHGNLLFSPLMTFPARNFQAVFPGQRLKRFFISHSLLNVSSPYLSSQQSTMAIGPWFDDFPTEKITSINLHLDPFGGFRKQRYPQIIHFHRSSHYKPTILGYPHDYGNPQLPSL